VPNPHQTLGHDAHQRAALALARSMRITHQAQIRAEIAGRAERSGVCIDWSELKEKS